MDTREQLRERRAVCSNRPLPPHAPPIGSIWSSPLRGVPACNRRGPLGATGRDGGRGRAGCNCKVGVGWPGRIGAATVERNFQRRIERQFREWYRVIPPPFAPPRLNPSGRGAPRPPDRFNPGNPLARSTGAGRRAGGACPSDYHIGARRPGAVTSVGRGPGAGHGARPQGNWTRSPTGRGGAPSSVMGREK